MTINTIAKLLTDNSHWQMQPGCWSYVTITTPLILEFVIKWRYVDTINTAHICTLTSYGYSMPEDLRDERSEPKLTAENI